MGENTFDGELLGGFENEVILGIVLGLSEDQFIGVVEVVDTFPAVMKIDEDVPGFDADSIIFFFRGDQETLNLVVDFLLDGSLHVDFEFFYFDGGG